MVGCRWPGCTTPIRRRINSRAGKLWCDRHDRYWRPFRWGTGHKSPEKVAELRALPYDEMVRRAIVGPREHREIPVQGLYRVMLDLMKADLLASDDEGT